MKLACVFPGQGSQKVGMGKDIYESCSIAKRVFDEVDDALNQNLSKIIFEGSNEELTLTENAQPALMVCSIAMLKTLEKKLNKDLKDFCSYVAGHSLGEFTALAATRSISLMDCARILKIRGQAMQEAVPIGKGAMFALLGANIQVALDIAKEVDCDVANDNSPGQQVLSGTTESIDKAIKIAVQKGYKTIRLKVSAPFHSRLMRPAQEKLKEALEGISITEPSVPLIANVLADITSAADIKKNLVEQVTGMVRWCDSIKRLQELGVTKIAEIGPGTVCTNLNKRIDGSLITFTSDDLLSPDLEVL
jgi:[acyl-carrier-protein] S-malonyltransferase